MQTADSICDVSSKAGSGETYRGPLAIMNGLFSCGVS